MDLRQTLKALCKAEGVSGEEQTAAQVAMQLLHAYKDEVLMDDIHNVNGVIQPPKPGQKTVLLDAHIDQIGLIVTHIDDRGFLKVANCGGVDRRLLLGQEVRVLSRTPVSGVVAVSPLLGEKKAPQMEEVLIDVGMSQKEACASIQVGDRVLLESEFCTLLGDRVSSMALDDRSGVACILDTLSKLNARGKLSGDGLPYGLTVLFSSQEETGEIGAKIGGYTLHPDIAIALDVSFAHTPDANEFKCGKMGKGVMIGIAPSLTKEISDTFLRLAREQQIPHQVEVMGGTTGTNADALGIQRGGMQTGLLSIPQKYMHTPIEVVDLADMESVSDLLTAYLLQLDGGVQA